jgi:hypothetical protein
MADTRRSPARSTRGRRGRYTASERRGATFTVRRDFKDLSTLDFDHLTPPFRFDRSKRARGRTGGRPPPRPDTGTRPEPGLKWMLLCIASHTNTRFPCTTLVGRLTQSRHAQVPVDHRERERLTTCAAARRASRRKRRDSARTSSPMRSSPQTSLCRPSKAGNFAEGSCNMGSSTMPQRDKFHESQGQVVCATRGA